MALDPAMKMVLEAIEGMNMPPFSEMKIEDLRKLMDENPILKPMEDIAGKEDLSIGTGKNRIHARLYDPGKAGKGLIVYLHGGGFVFGNIDSVENICIRLANSSGCRVLSVEYRLAPENRFPAAVEDAFESFRWAYGNAEKLGIDRDRIALAGDSAGGNLSAAVCLMLRDKKLEMPKLQVLIYPAVGPDFSSESMREFSDGFFLTAEQIRWFHDMYHKEDTDVLNPYFSPLLHNDHTGLPEAIIVTGEYDPLRDQGEAYVSKLRGSGVQVTGILASGMIHGFASFLNVVPAAKNMVSMVGSLAGSRLLE